MSAPSTANKTEPLISVILCTRNRADLLKIALDSLVAQAYPRDDFEVVVVDNASIDHTPQVIAQYDSLGIMRYVHEPNIGLCVARNTGWQSARGRLIAYFDDDAIAEQGWLAAVEAAFAANPTDLGVVGGRAQPMWDAPRPSWLADDIAYSLTIVDWGEERKFITDLSREWLVGANMAMPKHVLRGYRCMYWPEMAIQHLVTTARLEPRWFLRRYYWQGVSDAVMLLIERSPSPAERIDIAVARGKRMYGRTARISWPLATPKNKDAFADACFALSDAGFVAGLLGAAGH